jgi:methylglutaconyl-CoA hydratase
MSEPVLDIRRPSPHVAEVWLNRPDVRNAFNDGVIAALTEAFARLNQDADLRVVLLAGHGKAFCAGADLNWMRAMADYSWEENRADAQKLADMLWTLDRARCLSSGVCTGTAMPAAWGWPRSATCCWPATT